MALRRREHDYAARMFLSRSGVVRRLLGCSAAATLGLTLAACGGSTAGGSTPAGAAHSSNEQSSVAAKAGSGSANGGCAHAQAPVPRGAQRIPKPTLTLDPAKRYVVTLSTNCGVIDIQLDVREAPRTTASFAYLVKRGFYNDLTFHRVAADFVIQGGDPNGDGSGGPGYTIVEPPPSNMHYTLGTVAMAKTGSDPAGASGSQFFIVTTREASLPPQYALVGNVVGSLAGVETIAKLSTNPPQDGAPTTPVVISHATLSSS
jgi:peptidyl-prolyl cis-trans isomerase B (cyclophilin B)